MVPTFKSKPLITDLYSMNPPDSKGYYFLPPYTTKSRNKSLGKSEKFVMDQHEGFAE
jgi:hypothetical protein